MHPPPSIQNYLPCLQTESMERLEHKQLYSCPLYSQLLLGHYSYNPCLYVHSTTWPSWAVPVVPAVPDLVFTETPVHSCIVQVSSVSNTWHLTHHAMKRTWQGRPVSPSVQIITSRSTVTTSLPSSLPMHFCIDKHMRTSWQVTTALHPSAVWLAGASL